jgi:hypothetical protein
MAFNWRKLSLNRCLKKTNKDSKFEGVWNVYFKL